MLIRSSPCNSEARIEFGDTIASRLKLSSDGKIVLWPQPSDDPEDPQNVRLYLESIAIAEILTLYPSVVRMAEDHPIDHHHTRCGCPRLRFSHWSVLSRENAALAANEVCVSL